MRRFLMLILVCCFMASNAIASLAPTTPRKIDDFGNIPCDDEKARLDNFAAELRSDPTAQGYIVIYGGRRYRHPYSHSPIRLPRRGEAEARASRIMSCLTQNKSFHSGRITMTNGGYREQWMAELWVVPSGANPPTPSPTVKATKIKYRKGRAKPRDYWCEV